MVNRILQIDNIYKVSWRLLTESYRNIYIRGKLEMVNRILQIDNIYIRDKLEKVNRILQKRIYYRQVGDC